MTSAIISTPMKTNSTDQDKKLLLILIIVYAIVILIICFLAFDSVLQFFRYILSHTNLTSNNGHDQFLSGK
ncbi:hypothetical protein [Dyadobacter psychrophilus]|uniref:Uncharacterized protein n=1 Tax=Dyadobacter psychrophilus TaxID=651661 RepID=A0A1T5ESB9_9BACT|nr:hypothetical protein [Dyadobacter psychrophilus]SKB86872.1 hypothetical protein SAMN05660293_02731 [Dyadobacter psychrophilus]